MSQIAEHGTSMPHAPAAGTAHRPAVLAGALSRGLCLINKAQSRAPAGSRKGPRPRMLVLQGSPDATEQYIATMNAIFAAQACPFDGHRDLLQLPPWFFRMWTMNTCRGCD